MSLKPDGHWPTVNDELVLAPYGEAINTVAKWIVDGAVEFLGQICLPAAKEFRLLVRDEVHRWRMNHVALVLSKAESKVRRNNPDKNVRCPLRIALEVIEKDSWQEDALLQEMWAGLLASSCTEAGDDDTNLIFLEMLDSMTRLQAKILNEVCSHCIISVGENGVLLDSHVVWPVSEFKRFTATDDLSLLDFELLDLAKKGLVPSRSLSGGSVVELGPTKFALGFYVRCQGSRQSPAEYFSGKMSEQELERPQRTLSRRQSPREQPKEEV